MVHERSKADPLHDASDVNATTYLRTLGSRHSQGPSITDGRLSGGAGTRVVDAARLTAIKIFQRKVTFIVTP
jgi:hypothetical protein